MLIMIFIVISFEIIFENLYSLFAISKKIVIPTPLNLCVKDSSFLSMPPDIVGIKSALTVAVVGC